MLLNFSASLVLFLLLDWVWFSVFMKSFAYDQLRPLLRLSGDDIDVNILAAAMAYVCMAISVSVFLMPLIQSKSLVQVVLYSSLLGFLLFGVFDFTNMALLKEYSVKFVVVDIAWGTFLYGVTGTILFTLNNYITKQG